MKGFDDHLDNYGDPDPECEHTHKIGGRKFTHSHEGGDTPHSAVTHPDLDAPNQQPDDPDPGDDEPTVIVEGREYFTFHDDAICPECGVNRSTGRIADHMASEHSDDDDDYGDYYEENEDANFDVEDYDEMQRDDGITTDDFDHWPGGREFPS